MSISRTCIPRASSKLACKAKLERTRYFIMLSLCREIQCVGSFQKHLVLSTATLGSQTIYILCNYTFLNNSKYIVLFHKFLNAMFYLASHSDFNLQRTSVCGLVAQDLLGDNQCIELPMPPCPWQSLPNSSGPNRATETYNAWIQDVQNTKTKQTTMTMRTAKIFIRCSGTLDNLHPSKCKSHILYHFYKAIPLSLKWKSIQIMTWGVSMSH